MCNYPHVAGKKDAIYSVSNVLELFVLAIFLQPQRQFLYLFNIGKCREMGKVRKNLSENAEKQILPLQTPRFYKTHPV